MHLTQGWLLFLVSLSILGGMTWLGSLAERFVRAPERQHA
jgi:uncharacterized membrane protein